MPRIDVIGGEPFLNTQVCLSLVRKLRSVYGQSKDIWSWTGYTWEELQLETPDKKALLQELDILVDGRFDIKKRDLTLQFRGSSNQRIIDVQKSLQNGGVVLWDGLRE